MRKNLSRFGDKIGIFSVCMLSKYSKLCLMMHAKFEAN